MKKYIFSFFMIFLNCSLVTSAFSKETLALVISTLNNPFFISMKEGAENKANELGYELIVLDSQNDPTKELSNIEDIITRGVNAILINPTDSDAVSSSIRLANQANIPVFTLDRNTSKGEIISHIASDNIKGGQLAGNFIIEKLGENAKIAQLEGIPGASAARERGEGFIDALKKHNKQLSSSQPANFDRAEGLNVMENILISNPDISAVFAQNDEMALGASRAVQASGKDIIIVGFDGTEEGIKAVKNGNITATIAQQPNLIGSLGIETANDFLSGNSVEKYIPVSLKVVSQ